jgi:hypothetical protein
VDYGIVIVSGARDPPCRRCNPRKAQSCRAQGGTRTRFIVRIPLAAEPVINLTEERGDES